MTGSLVVRNERGESDWSELLQPAGEGAGATNETCCAEA
jgi:hypothetical protein